MVYHFVRQHGTGLFCNNSFDPVFLQILFPAALTTLFAVASVVMINPALLSPPGFTEHIISAMPAENLLRQQVRDLGLRFGRGFRYLF